MSRTLMLLVGFGAGAVVGLIAGIVIVALSGSDVIACTVGTSSVSCYDPHPGVATGLVLSISTLGGALAGTVLAFVLARMKART
jgi:hypothetical protein